MHVSMGVHFIFAFVFINLFLSKTQQASITITNNCKADIWVGISSENGKQSVEPTGFHIGHLYDKEISVPNPWSGKIWTRTGCDVNNKGEFQCDTGDCGSGSIHCGEDRPPTPPLTMVEFSLAQKGHGEEDYYHINLTNGFNVPAKVIPLTRKRSGQFCDGVTYSSNINAACPRHLAVRDSLGEVVGCKSLCVAFGKQQHCCTGNYSDFAKCKPHDDAVLFRRECPQVISYAADKRLLTSCYAGINYDLTFFPIRLCSEGIRMPKHQ